MFLEERELDAALTPEAFVEAHPDLLHDATGDGSAGGLERVTGSGAILASELIDAIRAAVEIERLLPGDTPLPRAIGPYEIRRELGRGGMGIVYEATRDGVSYALKLHPLSPLFATRVVDRLRREIETLASISHPNIVRIRDSGSHDGSPYIVMDLVSGRQLDQAAGDLTRAETIRIIERLARAVHEAHTHGVIHRDLKPQNVLLRPDGEPVLVDFGLSLSEDLATITVTGEMLGTPRYMAPEQVREGAADARTDIYGLGLILYELIAKQPARVARSREGLLRAASDGTMIRPRRIDGSIPKPLERILLQALAFQPSDRYPTAEALAEDLARFGRGERVLAHPKPLPEGPPRWLPSRRIALAAVGVLVVLLGAGYRGIRDRTASIAARKAEAVVHLRRALERHLDGDSTLAVTEIREAARLHRNDVTILGLGARLSRRPLDATAPVAARNLEAALVALEQRDPERSRGLLSTSEGLDPGVQSAVMGLAAARAGDAQVAEAELLRAHELLPDCVHLLERLANVYRRQGIHQRADETLRKAIAMDSTSTDLWRTLASLCLQRRDMKGGLEAIDTIRRLGDSTNVEVWLIEAALHANSGSGPKARTLLRRVLAREPKRVDAWYQLGYSHDMDHEILPARDAYQHACELKPDHAEAWSCLANLYSGASRGQCRGCDAAYAAHPEMLDLPKAEASLIRTLEIDRGKQDWIMKSSLDIALRLKNRQPVIDRLERLTAEDPSSASGLRLVEMLRRLKLNSAAG